MSIKNRVSNLEKHSRSAGDPNRVPGIPDELLTELRKVAATCATWQELDAHLKARTKREEQIISLDERRRSDAVTDAFARSLFDEVRS